MSKWMNERLREIYLPAFQTAVKEGDVLCVMGAYNLLRGQHCCENEYLLKTILTGEWGFKGLVMSDWGGVHSTDLAAKNGMDQEMGTKPPYDHNFLADAYLEGLKAGTYSTAELDNKVRRHLYVMFKLNLIHEPIVDSESTGNQKPLGVSTKQHQEVARRVAEESMVLLKNDGMLPLDSSGLKTIAVIGANAKAKFANSGGSANLKAPFEITCAGGNSAAIRKCSQTRLCPGAIWRPRGRRDERDFGDNINSQP